MLDQLYSTPVKNKVHAFGLTFKNPIGLAAGYDKDGTGWRGLACLGFSHIEVGTVTRKAQPGNPKPRIFRLVPDKAVINRMGFPGKGAEFVLRQLSKTRPDDLVLGVNIGKNKDTPLEEADQDYIYLLNAFINIADYIAINISSPNTTGLRRLQEKQALSSLLSKINIERERLTRGTVKKTPVLVKLSPDLSDGELDDALDVILDQGLDGVIATNTTLSREGLISSRAGEAGGLSGVPLFSRSLTMVRKIVQKTSGKLPVVGVGGINNATGVQKMLDAGAVLIQIYTAMIYEGPSLVKTILNEIYARSQSNY
jgi:dihydroorotate dehydrogenase